MILMSHGPVKLFKERRLLIIDKNILAWKPELIRLVELSEVLADNVEDTIKVEIESRNYEVKYLRQGLVFFLFKDITEFEYLFDSNQATAPVLGVVVIDNFVDIVVKGEHSNPIFGTVNSFNSRILFKLWGACLNNIVKMLIYLF